MTRTLLAAFIAAFVAAAPLGAADAVNTLTDKEKADGWKLLFDGQTTKGWHGYNQTSVPEVGGQGRRADESREDHGYRLGRGIRELRPAVRLEARPEWQQRGLLSRHRVT